MSDIPGEPKYKLMQATVPHPSFKFPSKDFIDKRNKTGVTRCFCHHDWFHTFPFITYSEKEEGIYCIACVLFPVKPKQGSHCKLLISSPHQNWKDAKADLQHHSTLEYHKVAMTKMSAFSQTMSKPETRIDHTLSERRKQQLEKNRPFLKSILKSLEICGRQGWSLRAHQDDSTSTAANKGNFRALLDF